MDNMELWIREEVFSFASIIMRVPPLFFIDELLRIGFGVADKTIIYNSTELGFKMVERNSVLDSIVATSVNLLISTQNWTGVQSILSSYMVYSYLTFLMTVIKFLACSLGKIILMAPV
jgi:E3 ubiquitin-protein ligase RNF139